MAILNRAEVREVQVSYAVVAKPKNDPTAKESYLHVTSEKTRTDVFGRIIDRSFTAEPAGMVRQGDHTVLAPTGGETRSYGDNYFLRISQLEFNSRLIATEPGIAGVDRLPLELSAVH